MDWSWIPSTAVLVALGTVIISNIRTSRQYQEKSFKDLQDAILGVKLELRQLNGTVSVHSNLIGNIETRCTERHLALMAESVRKGLEK